MNQVAEKEIIFEVTEADYRQQLAEIGDEDAVMKPGRYVFRRGGFRECHPNFKPEDLAPRNTRVTMELGLCLDILDYFKAKAAASGAETFEAQINAELRALMEQEKAAQPVEPYVALLEDERFLQALAAKLQNYKPKRQRRAA